LFCVIVIVYYLCCFLYDCCNEYRKFDADYNRNDREKYVTMKESTAQIID